MDLDKENKKSKQILPCPSSFIGYLNAFRVQKGSFTHTSMLNPTGSFYIFSNEESSFFDQYRSALKRKEDLYVTETHRDICPVLIDFDFRFKNVEPFCSTRQYTIPMLKSVMKCYLDTLLQYVDIQEYFEVYLLEKSKQREEKGKVKDGVHIIISNVVTRPSVQLIVREKILPELKNIFNDLQCENSIEDIFDECVIDKNNWQMYGSKKVNSEPYVITRYWTWNVLDNKTVFDEPTEQIIVKHEPWKYVEKLSIRNKHEESVIRDEKLDEVHVRDIEINDLKDKKKQISLLKQTRSNVKLNESNQYELSQKLIKLLKPERANSYQSWIYVGWCLRNIDHRLLPEWIEFSKQSSKYVDGECESIWNYMQEKGMGMGTLCMWTKEDSPREYENIRSNDLSYSILISMSCLDYDIAQVVYNLFRDEFSCASIKDKSWFHFENHRWQRCPEGHKLKNKLSTDLFNKYKQVQNEFNTKSINCDNPDEASGYDNKSKTCKKIMNKLKTTGYKETIMKESTSIFYCERFEMWLDNNPKIIGFDNGILDLNTMIFREGHPEDYITFTTGINYTEFDYDDPMVQEILEFLRQVLPDEEKREYVLTMLSTMLDGENKEEKFYIWTGQGSNGKSKLVELLQKTLKDYAGIFNVSMLTNKRVNSNDTNSELVQSKGKRFMVLQEPDEKQTLNAGLLKEMSGNDTMSARALYKEPIEIKPQFKMVLTCNTLPNLPSDDGGVWRRVRLVEFTSKFVENPNPENTNEFPINQGLSNKFEDWREPFMWILVQYYKKYTQFGIHEPDSVLKCTKQYQQNNDTLKDFTDAYIKQSSEQNDRLYLDELYDEMKEWHKVENIPGKVISKKELKKYLDKTLNVAHQIERRNTYWKGFKQLLSTSGDLAFYAHDDDNLDVNC